MRHRVAVNAVGDSIHIMHSCVCWARGLEECKHENVGASARVCGRGRRL
jgi:hypothetical protein